MHYSDLAIDMNTDVEVHADDPVTVILDLCGIAGTQKVRDFRYRDIVLEAIKKNPDARPYEIARQLMKDGLQAAVIRGRGRRTFQHTGTNLADKQTVIDVFMSDEFKALRYVGPVIINIDPRCMKDLEALVKWKADFREKGIPHAVVQRSRGGLEIWKEI